MSTTFKWTVGNLKCLPQAEGQVFVVTEITWLLVKTVQEQQAIITTLTDRITALEARNG